MRFSVSGIGLAGLGLAFVGLALLVVAFGRPPVAQATHTTVGDQGLQGGWAIDDGGNANFYHSLSSQFGSMHQAGAGWVRINFRLGDCFKDWTSRGCNRKTALQVYTEVVNNARNNNLQVLGLLSNESWAGGQSQWTANNAEHNRRGSGDNRFIRDFADKAAGVLARHFNGTNGPLVSQWEVWNEPNAWTSSPQPGVYEGGSFIYPSNFAWLLKRSHAAIKNAQPAATVISGGLFGHDIGGATVTILEDRTFRRVTKQGTFTPPGRATTASAVDDCPRGSVPSGADYLCDTYNMGIQKAGWSAPYPLDHVGQHLYVDQGGATSSSKISTYLQDVRNAYAAYEGSATPKQAHMTEFGWATNVVSYDVQASNLQTAYETFEGTSQVGRAYWFSVQDIPEGAIYYGLLDTDGVEKPAFAAYRTYAAY